MVVVDERFVAALQRFCQRAAEKVRHMMNAMDDEDLAGFAPFVACCATCGKMELVVSGDYWHHPSDHRYGTAPIAPDEADACVRGILRDLREQGVEVPAPA